jgi:hypothetical protein
MEKITIDTMRDIIIVEKFNGNNVVLGSKFYCGCCGNVLGVSNKEMTFPFSGKTFEDSLENKTFTIERLGLSHKTCRHIMFSFKKGYKFIPLEVYVEKVPQ